MNKIYWGSDKSIIVEYGTPGNSGGARVGAGRPKKMSKESEVSKLPKLADGYEYGKNIEPHEIQKGDLFIHPGNEKHGRMEGVIEKVNPKNIKHSWESTNYDGLERKMVTTKSTSSNPHDSYVGGFVARGKIIHPIVYKEKY